MDHVCRLKRGGGLVGLQNDLLNKEWADMCGAVYNPATVTYEPKIYGVMSVGEAPPTGGGGGVASYRTHRGYLFRGKRGWCLSPRGYRSAWLLGT